MLLGDFKVTNEVLKIRWNAYEASRKEKLNKVMDERRNVINEKLGKHRYAYKTTLHMYHIETQQLS